MANLKPAVKSAIKNVVANALRAGGGALGSYMGGPAGGIAGREAGAFVSRIIGTGDYDVKENTVLKGPVPQFGTGGRCVRIQHREFLRDITGSTAFSSSSYSINPGNVNCFPWLSRISANFATYRIRGMVFEFVSTSADALNSVNTALGSVVMATQYNVLSSDFVSKSEMEQYEFTTTGRPSINHMHPIECNPEELVMKHLYVRSGAVPAGQDARMYDMGKFQIATAGMQAAATIGELWISYDVELYKPRIAPGGALSGLWTRIVNGPYVAASDPLGSIQTTPVGDLGVTVVATAGGWDTLYFPPMISTGRFVLMISWVGTVGAALTAPARTLTNCSYSNLFNLGTAQVVSAPNAGVVTTAHILSFFITINGYSATGSTIQFGLAGVLPATPAYVNIYIESLDYTDSYV